MESSKVDMSPSGQQVYTIEVDGKVFQGTSAAGVEAMVQHYKNTSASHLSEEVVPEPVTPVVPTPDLTKDIS